MGPFRDPFLFLSLFNENCSPAFSICWKTQPYVRLFAVQSDKRKCTKGDSEREIREIIKDRAYITSTHLIVADNGLKYLLKYLGNNKTNKGKMSDTTLIMVTLGSTPGGAEQKVRWGWGRAHACHWLHTAGESMFTADWPRLPWVSTVLFFVDG